jgi:hypothetical protein
MIVKVNASVRPQTYKGTFIVKLLEVDMYADDLLEQKVERLSGDSMGYQRDRNVPEVVAFEFFISAARLAEVTAELQIAVYSKEGELLANSEVVNFHLLKEYSSMGTNTIELPEVII